MSKSREWIAKGKFDISVIEQSLEYYKQDVKDSIHYTEEEKTIFLIMNVMGHFEAPQKENEELREALREAIGYVETSIPEPSHFGSCTPETFCDMTCSEIFHTSNLIYKIKNLLSKHHGERK